MSGMQDYWDALGRLKAGKPVRLPKGSPINKDSVALEAGRGRGSIKRSRESFLSLISAIENAANADESPTEPDILRRYKEAADEYKDMYHRALNRELMLVERVARLEKELARFSNIVPIKK